MEGVIGKTEDEASKEDHASRIHLLRAGKIRKVLKQENNMLKSVFQKGNFMGDILEDILEKRRLI